MQAISAGPSCSWFASRRGLVDFFATGSLYTFYTFFVPVRRCSFLEKSAVSFTGCSREDSSSLPWSGSSRETGTAWSVAGLMISSNDILAHMHVWMCVHTQLYVSPYWDRKPLPCCSFNFSINTVYKHCLRQQFPFMFTFLWTVLNQPFKSSVYKLELFLCGFHIKILRYQPLCR